MSDIVWHLGKFLAENPILLLFAIIALGFLVGEIRFPGGLRFGVAAVLFVGLGVGFLWPEVQFPTIIAPLGLALFIYCLGLQSGPGFLRSFQREGLGMTLCLLGSLLAVFAGCLVMIHLLGAPPALVVGMFAGVTTNTAALGSATEAAVQLGAHADAVNEIVLGYALHYPIGIILTLVVLHFWPKSITSAESEVPRPRTGPSFPQTFEVTQTHPDGSPWSGESLAAHADVILSRFQGSDGEIDFVHPETILAPGSRVVAVTDAKGHDRMLKLVGPVSSDSLQTRWEGFEKERFFVSQKAVVGIPLRRLRLDQKGIVISRIRRGDVEIPVSGDARLQLGDRVRAIYRTGHEDEVIRLLGNSLTTSTETGYLSFVVGIIGGMLLGLVPLPLPFLESPLRLGVAGGALVAGLILGARGRTGPLVWHLPITVNLTLRQTGLLFFLAGAGLQAGAGLESALPLADWRWVSLGLALLLLSQILFLGLISLVVNFRSPAILGSLAAMQTQPGALAFSLARAPGDAVNKAYATLYPSALILKILLAQILILTLQI